MASAFECANTSLVVAASAAASQPQEQPTPTKAATATGTALESETEDEEVKLNCIGGATGLDESDMNTTDHSDESEDEEEENRSSTAKRDGEDGVLNFVSGHVRGALPLVRPKATPPPHHTALSPHVEEQEEMETSSNSSGEVESGGEDDDTKGEASAAASDHPSSDARDVALLFGAPSGVSTTTDTSSSQTPEEDNHLQDMSSDPLTAKELMGVSDVLGLSLGQQDMDDSESAALDHLLGVSKDREDFCIPLAKRVLSFNTLVALNAEAGGNADSPKRRKSSSLLSPSVMPAFSLGSPAAEPELFKMHIQIQVRRESPAISSSDDEELDGQLRDELDPQSDDNSIDRENSPVFVPLLTPPQSPMTIEVMGGGTTTVCEWPSNLAVETAMRAAADGGEEVVQDVVGAGSMSPDADTEPSSSSTTLLSDTSSSSSRAAFDTSSLTPLLQGISVGNYQQ